MKKSHLPTQGEGVIRDTNRSCPAKGVEASGIGKTILKAGISLLPIPGAGFISNLI